MSNTDLVRASRDGDQFHYIWAARRCLLLLSPTAELRAVTIEGPSLREGTEQIKDGEELVDVGEYFGSEHIEQASRIRYVQIKHSTHQEDEHWPPSGLEKTIKGFAKRYKKLIQDYPTVNFREKLEFVFLTNRPIHTEFVQAVKDAALGKSIIDRVNHKKLEGYTGLSGQALTEFCQLLVLEEEQDGLWNEALSLVQDLNNYLPDSDANVPTALKELVTGKATSKGADNPSITKIDVLRALKTTEDSLFPAPCLIKQVDNLIARNQEQNLFEQIKSAEGVPIIIHADGGVGKSAFAIRILSQLADGENDGILYDCFGDGQYRSASGYRHRHRDALIQIANELAAKGLCHPLIPTPHADSSAYMRAFLYRIQQSITGLRSNNAKTLLYLVIDAADNAQMAAMEVGSHHAFVRDLIREQMPNGVRLIFLCRSHRQEHLSPPPQTLALPLLPFEQEETQRYLKQTFPDVRIQDVSEFHRLSSQNPRVQALAIAQQLSLPKMLRWLGPTPSTVEDTIASLLKSSVEKLRDEAVGNIEKEQIDSLCAALAALRPLIPIPVLSLVSGVDDSAIKSFVYDLKRPLFIAGDRIRFLDEPTETWFREHFKPTKEKLAQFIATLIAIAPSSAYIAATLPQLMLEAGMLTELIELALSSQALPDTSPIEKRDIELQRLDFAFKACLREKRYTDATKLALKAGGESAGDKRQRTVLQKNTDLVSCLLSSEKLEELVAQRAFSTSWMGGHYAYESSMLSGNSDLLGEARSKLRMAYEWLRNWSRLPEDKKDKERVSRKDIANVIWAVLNINGVNSCAVALREWRPKSLSYDVGRVLAQRLIDQGRYKKLEALSIAAGNNIYLVLAINQELREVHKAIPQKAVERCYKFVNRVHLKLGNQLDSTDYQGLQAITALVESACIHSITDNQNLADLLTRYLPKTPPQSLSSRYGATASKSVLLWAYVLRGCLRNRPIELMDLASSEIKKELQSNKNGYSHVEGVRRLKENIGALLPWYQLWGKVFVGSISEHEYSQELSTTKGLSGQATAQVYGHDKVLINNEIVLVWFTSLLSLPKVSKSHWWAFYGYATEETESLLTPTSTYLSRIASRREGLQEYGLEFASASFERINAIREDADTQINQYIELSRAVLALSQSEAKAYFDQAIQVASKVGDENLDRWNALLTLANHPKEKKQPQPETAYRLARCAELTHEYLGRSEDLGWDDTVKAITTLCPNSSLTIVSRWRDRDFGYHQSILPVVVLNFLEQRALAPKPALALLCIRANWNIPQLLSYYLANEADQQEKQRVTEYVFRYFSLEKQSWKDWQAFQALLQKYKLTIDAFSQCMENNTPQQIDQKHDDHNYLTTGRSSEEEKDWADIFSEVDLYQADGVRKAYKKFRDGEPPYYSEQFFNEACRRVGVGKEVDFINAISDANCFDFYEIRDLLGYFPEKWKKRLAIKPALANMIKKLCRRSFSRFSLNQYYQSLPMQLVFELAGLTQEDLIDQVLLGIAEAIEALEENQYFKWASFLVSKLDREQSIEALNFGLDLLEGVLDEKDGDGPWSTELMPPADINTVLAGYLWSCLAAPQASLRWEAAHTVRTLAYFKEKAVLPQIVTMDGHTTASVFADASLPFYHLHARLWLLIALARSAQESPVQVACYQDYLLQNTFSDEPHVLIQAFAKQALLELVKQECLVLPEETYQRLLQVNISPFPIIESEKRIRSSRSPKHVVNESTEEKQFYFGIDMGPYWFEPLARCFGVTQQYIEKEAAQVIMDEWGIQGNARGDNDPRYTKNVYKWQNTQHSKSFSPKTDDLLFYLSYHAMMVVAGKLLTQISVYKDIYSERQTDQFSLWLREHNLYRHNGHWLADRRDPNPFAKSAWQNAPDFKEWHLNLNKTDFERALIIETGCLNLWGQLTQVNNEWTEESKSRKESINICSALVSPSNSHALLRALQSTISPHDYRIPSAEDDEDFQLDIDGFKLQGWISHRHIGCRLDEKDPWRGEIQYPAPEFASYICELMQLSSDTEKRNWFTKAEEEVAWSYIWGQLNEYDRDTELDHGSLLQVSYPFVIQLLQRLNMDLIVEVEIDRSVQYFNNERRDNYGFRAIPPNTKLFLIRTDGRIVTV
ncbi:NACHT domain-containing protein [Marinomonas spartinae]|uniref:NACHT domain-containing protein n=1 Tax=Marinomonas spartinae TaxID=1792290 RepID=UPI0018F19640|nr:NACHT domain-containing protein [Marinomonas spartinae]MBJ7554048.1 NACHT domain-containing protein [Marinomonas spartinae]